jgi:hypothetical protein
MKIPRCVTEELKSRPIYILAVLERKKTKHMNKNNSMNQSSLREAYSQDEQEVLPFPLSQKVHYRVNKSPKLDPIMS